MFKEFINLFYPEVCFACENPLVNQEKVICTYCKYHLPQTNFHRYLDNPVSKIFWGRVNIYSAASYYYFYKGTKVQNLLHHFKYNGYKEIGIIIGELYGNILKYSPYFNTCEAIIPVPLHKTKERKRGYNQSEMFAIGLSKSMKIPCISNILFRSKFTETQTKKTRIERWENVKEVFKLKNEENLANKHILLVDDVVTTGSTLEACANVLSTLPGIKISIATIAYASNI